MKRREAGLHGAGFRFVVQICEGVESVWIDADDPIEVTGRIPVVGVILDARDRAVAVVVEAGIDCRRCEQVRDMEERRGRVGVSVDVDAEQRFMVDFRKQPLLVLELEVIPQPPVQRFSERAALRVVVHALRVQEPGYAALGPDHPRLRQETLV